MRNLLLSLMLLLPLATALSARADDEVKPAAAAKADEKPFTPPPGWRTKQRGQFTIYCRKQSEQGTRLPKEVCYDEEGIRAMLAAQLDDREKVDQLRRICSSPGACGSN